MYFGIDAELSIFGVFMGTGLLNKALLMLSLAAMSLPAMAEELALYMMVVPPLTVDEVDRKGPAGDIALEAIKRAGDTCKLLVVPSNRAMVEVRQAGSRDVLIVPLARQKERESFYTWITPVAKVDRAFFSMTHRVRSFDEARATFHSIAVARGTAGLNILREQGFADSQLVEVVDAIAASKMLIAGRVDAWYGPLRQFKSWQRETDPQNRVQMGAELGSTFNYLACSKQCSPALVSRLAEEIDKMHRDGTIKAIEARYSKGE